MIIIGENHTIKELSYTCRDSGTSTIVCRPQYMKLANEIAGSIPNIKVYELMDYKSLMQRSMPKDGIKLDSLEKDDALLLYTSGTTGHPKGVLLTRENIKVKLHNLSLKAQIEAMQQAWAWSSSDHLVLFEN